MLEEIRERWEIGPHELYLVGSRAVSQCWEDANWLLAENIKLQAEVERAQSAEADRRAEIEQILAVTSEEHKKHQAEVVRLRRVAEAAVASLENGYWGEQSDRDDPFLYIDIAEDTIAEWRHVLDDGEFDDGRMSLPGPDDMPKPSHANLLATEKMAERFSDEKGNNLIRTVWLVRICRELSALLREEPVEDPRALVRILEGGPMPCLCLPGTYDVDCPRCGPPEAPRRIVSTLIPCAYCGEPAGHPGGWCPVS